MLTIKTVAAVLLAAALLSPMMQEIAAAWQAQAEAVAALEARVPACADPAEALALQRRIEDLRVQGEIQILTIQARWARAEGRLDDANAIEAAVAAMTAPQPAVRPAAGER